MSGTPRVIPNLDACIDCGACEVACNRTWDLPQDTNRIRVVTHNEGDQGGRFKKGETNVPMSCYHCEEAPCMDVCPTDALYKDEDGLVQIDKDDCIGCSYCAWSCPFGAPQFPEEGQSTGDAGPMDKCDLCKPRLDEGKDPACVSECPTDALVFGTPSEISTDLRENRTGDLFKGDLAGVVFGDD